MFCTLKAGDVAGEPYAFHATPPPFNKKRDGKTNKVACNACRTSKLRCSGGPGSSRRCSLRKSGCEYPSPPRSTNQSKETSPALPTIPDTLKDTNSPDLGEVSNEILYPESLTDATFDFETPDVTPTLVEDFPGRHMSLEHEALWQNHQISSIDSNQSLGSGSEDISDMIFDCSIDLSTPGQSHSSSHSVQACLQQVISTNETIEVIMWSQREVSSDVYDILQQQKTVIARCEELLDCQTCCAQPQFVMSLLSMCRNILGTLNQMTQEPAEDECRDEPGTSGISNKRRRSTYNSMGADGRRSYGISARTRQLDDDDELSILQSLVAVRVKMLRRILSKVETLVTKNHWLVHGGICREMQASLR